MPEYDFQTITGQFSLRAISSAVRPYGSGHINDTFFLRSAAGEKNNYLLQRINHRVFKNIPQMMRNIEIVTGHIQKKISQTPNADVERRYLKFLPAKNGKLYYQDVYGNYWRACVFIANSRSFDRVDNCEKAWQAGKAFGHFQQLLVDLPADLLHETIPHFHNVKKRLVRFRQVIAANPAGRVSSVQKEITAIEQRAAEMPLILHLAAAGEIPLRLTHNDTKINNILFDENNKTLCVIDLDTVMPGYVHYDFGDGIRTACNCGEEDDADLENVGLDIEFFAAYAGGFLEEMRPFLNLCEIEHLAFSAKLLTFIMALRFLTDFIDGDNYYKVHHKSHNLQRARAQLQLLRSMEMQFKNMQEIIRDVAGL